MLPGGAAADSRARRFRAAARTSRVRSGSQRGSLRRRDTEESSPSSCCKSNVRRYCRITSGMLIRSAAEKFCKAISTWRSGDSSKSTSFSIKL